LGCKKAKQTFVIDASEVSRITTPCVQIIISLFKMFSEVGIVIKIINPSNVFKSSFQDLGLESFLTANM
jgi:anti-anti-sigma regulatory factor